MEPAGYRSLIVVTNDWHMPRTQAIFSHIFSLPLTRTTAYTNDDDTNSKTVSNKAASKYELKFESVASGLDEKVLELRTQREAASLQRYLEKTQFMYRDLRELHEYIFRRHNAYATARHQIVQKPLDPELLKSY